MTAAVETPVGWLCVRWNSTGVTHAWFADEPPETTGDDPHGAAVALRDWLAGRLDALAAVPVAAEGTPFQQTVWAELRRIEPGTTSTYRALARTVDRPTATRAVARANATNPVAVIVPCHRVIGADGALRGYAGGLERKRWLLAHEGAPGFLVP